MELCDLLFLLFRAQGMFFEKDVGLGGASVPGRGRVHPLYVAVIVFYEHFELVLLLSLHYRALVPLIVTRPVHGHTDTDV